VSVSISLLAVYDKDDNLKQRFHYAEQRMPLSMTDSNGTKYYFHYDQVGTLKAVSRVLSPDNTNLTIIKEISHDTYGNILSDSNETFTVPFGFAGGDSNLYGYVLGDPVNKFDPTGLREWPWTDVDYDMVNHLFCTRGYGSALTYCSGFFYNKNSECRTYLDRINTGLSDPKCDKKDDNLTCQIQ